MLKRSLLTLMAVVSSFTAAKAQSTEPIDVGMVFSRTEFVAHNYSTATQVLVFHCGLSCTWRVLAPGTEFTSTYTREMLDGVTVEIANYDAGIWRTSRSFSMASLCDSGADAVWVRNHAAIASWMQIAEVLTAITPGPSLLPVWMPATAELAVTLPAPSFAAAHVPVVTPVNTQGEDTPPILNQRPVPLW
jgi:hypothetical protein